MSWDAKQYQQRHSYVFEYGRAPLDLLAPQPGEKILDLGCGSGQLTAAIAEAGASVIGLDASPAMLIEARANFPGIDFRLGDAAEFSLDESVDAVFSNATLHWVKNADAAALCIARVLKPGGRFVAEFGGHGNIQSVVDALRAVLGQSRHPGITPASASMQRFSSGTLSKRGTPCSSIAQPPSRAKMAWRIGSPYLPAISSLTWMNSAGEKYFTPLPKGSAPRIFAMECGLSITAACESPPSKPSPKNARATLEV
jgi:SAM-dependent methyltransferase